MSLIFPSSSVVPSSCLNQLKVYSLKSKGSASLNPCFPLVQYKVPWSITQDKYPVSKSKPHRILTSTARDCIRTNNQSTEEKDVSFDGGDQGQEEIEREFHDNRDASVVTYSEWLMRSAVHEVAECFPTAIVTGRSRDKAIEFVKLKDLCYAGSHGMHISIPPGFLKKYAELEDQTHIADEQGFINFYVAKKFLCKLKKIKEKLQEKTRGIKGAMVEDNKFCISVHFRCVDEENVENVKKIVDSVIKSYPSFRAGGGKKVMEVRPNIEWNKGHALDYLLKTVFGTRNDDVLPLYVGDDATDEDAFKFIKEVGRGFPIVVSSTPKMTDASFSLRDTIEVMNFLTKLTGWRRISSSD
ncbi:probable trehalose-phosphate phosphatase J isoform X2 [Corylus avellana]|uniref:probable trehalose-phosphate phosphatase J isoform X2 n=1 Tax=Corylus avellana TaxID=13451 RepID=UPI00286BA5FA|nr:probable trehalose-phosphate phosphatase J isoform X2 [Corylus avellana]